MWKNLSLKTQLILILLIPISGLTFMTISNINHQWDTYKSVDHSLEKINNIAQLSRGISEISVERGFLIYSLYNPSKANSFGREKQKTIDWFSNVRIDDELITKTLTNLKLDILEIQNNIQNGQDTNIFIRYTNLNNQLRYLIEREIINCESSDLAKLADNYYNYVTLKEASLLKRGVVVQKLINLKNHITSDDSVFELYTKAKNYEDQVNFKIETSGFNNGDKNLIEFRNSNATKAFSKDAESVIDQDKELDIDKWWKKSTEIINKYTQLEKGNLAYILDYANKEKQTVVHSMVLLGSFLFIFLLTVIIIIYNLINTLSDALREIASSIKKLSLGKAIEKLNFLGNTEFRLIGNSFDNLLNAIEEQINLSIKISSGNYGDTIKLRSTSDSLNNSLNNMSLELKRFNDESNENSLLEKQVIQVNQSIINSKDLNQFGNHLCNILTQQTRGCQAAFYVIDYTDKNENLIKMGSYADNHHTPKTIQIGEGLIGEAVKKNEQKCLNNLHHAYSFISSSLGKSPFYNVLITPISYKNSVIGVIEIGSLENFTRTDKNLLNTLKDSIGSAIEVFIRNEELKKSMEEINHKNNVLQIQEEELRQSNDELNKHTLLLQQSEEELKNQAAELEQTNAYLEEKGRELENKNYEIEAKNKDLLIAQEKLNIKSEEIVKANKYKSEFLANMSHELRTPLNSILILSDLLKENVNGNLSNAQIDNLAVINSSGKDLLNLITDILDISKIEAGKVEIYPEESVIERVLSDMDSLFRAQMEKKEINFKALVTGNCPRKIHTDIGKIEQIIKNFLSNALKFTPKKGKVTLTFDSGIEKREYTTPSLALLPSDEILSIHIEDNGIGISEQNKKKLFQSFQQADSSTNRKYGGTGLGLFISKELAILLGGEVSFQSELNNGSVFSLFVPINYKSAISKQNKDKESKEELIETEYQNSNEDFIDLTANIEDDRNKAGIDDKTILIIEDDASFAQVLLQVAHDSGFKAIIAYQGETGFQYARKYNPKAIILDMKLPGIDGWTVLKWLKEDPKLQHIPVHVMSGMKREKLAKEMGAFDFLVKPITPKKLKEAFQSIDNQINKIYKKILIVEDDIKLNYSIKELVHSSDKNVICLQAHSRFEAETILKNDEIDCAIIDLSLPDSDNIKTVSEIKKTSKNKDLKIIVNTGKKLSDEDQLELEKNVESIVIKTNDVTERLKDELLLFLNKIETTEDLKYKTASNVSDGEILKNKNILIVDDDIRNIYSLSAALSNKGAIILTAFNGIEALKVLENNSNIDIVLMDIMMPEMDGFEATAKIREKVQWRNLPIIALTAKAMKGDRDEILKAGASDYQSKPIDIQKLIALISIWIYK